MRVLTQDEKITNKAIIQYKDREVHTCNADITFFSVVGVNAHKLRRREVSTALGEPAFITKYLTPVINRNYKEHSSYCEETRNCTSKYFNHQCWMRCSWREKHCHLEKLNCSLVT